jgi:AcrR family transcriptional regulator
VPSARRQPVQRRSRERVDQIIAAASELINETGAEELSTRDVATRAQIPIGSVYRYFTNSDEIVSAYLAREMTALDKAAAAETISLQIVSLRTLCEAAIYAHYRHHQSHPMTLRLWFGGGQSRLVREQIEAQQARLAAWLWSAARGAGLLRDDAPTFGAELIVRLCDRMFEFALLRPRPREQQDEIVERFVAMVATELEAFATPAGLNGIPAADFTGSLGSQPTHPPALAR